TSGSRQRRRWAVMLLASLHARAWKLVSETKPVKKPSTTAVQVLPGSGVNAESRRFDFWTNSRSAVSSQDIEAVILRP
ncbi:hypothetical protein EDD18DRAFT_1157007, partial [Armillaria luteobubalina]